MKQHLESRLRDSPILLMNTSMEHDRSSPLPQEQRLTSSDTAKPAAAVPSNSRRSKSIPLPSSHVERTHSEVQLCEDMESAERRDLNMFYRLVNGIRERQVQFIQDPVSPLVPHHAQHHEQPQPHHYHHHDAAAAASHKQYMAAKEAESCVAHIIHTRNTPLDKASYLQQHHHGSDQNSTSMLPSNSGHRTSMPSNSGHRTSMEATLALQAMNQGAPSDPEHHQDEEGLVQHQGDWPLSGFEEEGAASAALRLLKVEQQELDNASESMQEEDDDEGIFDLDL